VGWGWGAGREVREDGDGERSEDMKSEERRVEGVEEGGRALGGVLNIWEY